MVAVVVGIAVLAAPTGGLSIALGAALSISASVASAIITVALSVAASLAFRALGMGAPKPTSQVGPPQVFRQSIANSFIVYGKRRVGGLMVFFHGAESGGDHFRYFVIACAGHHCQGLTKWFLNDEEVTVDGSNMVTTGPYASAAWLWFQEGVASETANATFVSECGGKWTTDHKGNGVAAIYAKFQMTEDVVQAGMPNITAEVDGKDDIDDPTGGAAGYTNLASRVFYDWMALPREEGGFGAYADEIPDDTYMAAQSNVCDETVNGEDRYTINAVITTGAPPAEIRDVMIVNCAGSYTYSGGKHLMRPGYWVPVSESLSEDDLAGPIQVSAFLPGDQAANEVQGTYIEPTNGYQGMPFATQSIASSDVRQMDLDLAFTTSKHQAERIASIMLNRAQAEKSVVWPMNIEGLKVKALDTVQLDTSRYGLSNYAFQVLNWGLSADWGVVLSLREENADIYDAPSPVSAPSVPAIVVPDPMGGPVNPDNVLPAEDPTVGGLLTLTDGQIKFPATANPSADANTLDDYEEGTFTPALAFGGASTGITYSAQNGRYTKIGRIVFIDVGITLTDNGTATGSATITGLPFTAAAGGANYSGSAIGVSLTGVDEIVAFVGPASATIQIREFTGSTIANLTEANIGNTASIFVSISYTV